MHTSTKKIVNELKKSTDFFKMILHLIIMLLVIYNLQHN